MKESVLQLRDYFITKTSVELNQEFRLDEPSSLNVGDLSLEISSNTLAHPDTREEIFKVELRVAVKSENLKKCNIPYCFDISSVGIFVLGESCQENREKVAVINCASILFSSVRDYLAGITGQGPFRRIVLPTVDLRSLEKNEK